MPQPTDITINAAGYMIDPGTTTNPGYKRLQDGYPEGRTTRLSITDFYGGQHRALQLERDRFGDSLRIGPALNGQGVIPWAENYDHADGNAPTLVSPVSKDTPVPFAIVRDRLYFAVGKTLYRGHGTTVTGPWGFTTLKTYANTITDLCIYGSSAMLLCFGSAADILFYNTLTNTDTPLFAGERGTYIAPYAGYAVWSDARTGSRPTVMRQVTGVRIEERYIDHDPVAITIADAELYVISKQAVYSYAGRVREVMMNNPAWTSGGSQPAQIPGQEWTGEYTPFYQQGVYTEVDDFRVFTGFGGRILAWIAGGIHELVKSGERAGWRSTGLSGRRCFGGTVAAGYLVVSIESESGKNDIWAYDGVGWWRIATQPMPAPGAAGTWCNPIPYGTPAYASNVAFFIEGEANRLRIFLLRDQLTVDGALKLAIAPSGELITSMLDAGERDKTKAWRKVGAVFSSPVLLNKLDSDKVAHVFLHYSTDAGQTWILADVISKSGNSLANMNFDLQAALSGVTSRFIMLKVTWANHPEWAPVLTGLWVEYEVMDTPARRRKWQLRIHARDQEVDRDGAVFTRTGRQLIAELWQAWQNDTILPFRDIDYDASPVQRTVRIVGISEHVAQPADANAWGDALITINLVEV